MDLKLKDNSQLTLPIGHMPVEYIESSGYPNIGLGTSWSFNTLKFIIDIELEVISNTTADSTIYTCSYTNGPYFYLKCRDADDITTFIACGSKQSTSTADAVIEFSGKVHIMHQRGSIKVNDTTYTLSTYNKGVSANAYLLPSGAPSIRIYSIKVSNGTTTYFDCIPVISYQEGHLGEACLFNKINNSYLYSNSTGSFTANPSQTLYSIATSAYVKDCPNISGINLLRSCINLNRVRIDIGNQSGPISELFKYAAYSGFNDNYENQTKPKIVGTFTITDYWSYGELSYLQLAIDGLTIGYDSEKNIDTLLENGDFAIQTLDSNKAGYNPAVAIVLNNNNIGFVTQLPINEGNGRYLYTKADAANFTNTNLGTIFREVISIEDTNSIVSNDNEQSYDFESFDEFEYFTSITTITAGSSTTVLGAFGGCTSLTSIKIPSSVTSIGAYSFYNCTGFNKTINIPNTVTSIGTFALSNFGQFSDSTHIEIPSTVTSIGDRGIASPMSIIDNATSTRNSNCYHIASGLDANRYLIIHGSISHTSNSYKLNAGKVIIYGNVNTTKVSSYPLSTYTYLRVFRVKGTYTAVSAGMILYNYGGNANPANLKFVEIMDNSTGGVIGATTKVGTIGTDAILHFGYNGLITSTVTEVTRNNTIRGRIAKICVGDGSSKAADQAVFDLYNADTNWTTYCGSGVPGAGKVDLWWNYNGEYKWYYITDNLTNCTNTNPDAWPHITRGDSYETTIVADEGMTIDSVTVEMLDTDTTSSTYDTMVDITSSVYDSSTGEINIPSVTGNVVITASAS